MTKSGDRLRRAGVSRRRPDRWGATWILACTVAAGVSGCASDDSTEEPPAPTEPAQRSGATLTFDGRAIDDPYQWMEEMDRPEVESWAHAQDSLARAWTGAVPGRDRIRNRIRAVADHERYLAPWRRGSRYFYVQINSSATRVSVLVREGLESEPTVLVSADELEARGEVADRSVWPSPDGSVVAYGVTPRGSRWMELRFRDVESATDLPDRVRGLQARRLSSVSWSPDGTGVFYDGFEPPDESDTRSQQLTRPRLAYHRLGNPQSADRIWLERDSTGATLRHSRTDDGQWVVISERLAGSGHDRVHIMPADGSRGPRALIDGIEAPFQFAGNSGAEIWLYTTHDAPNGRVVGVRAEDPRPGAWRTVVPEQAEPIDTWTGIRAVGDRLVGGFRKDGELQLRLFRPGGAREAGRVDLPTLGSVWFGVTGGQRDPDFYFVLSGFADPGTVYRHDLSTGETTVFAAPEIPFDPDRVHTRLLSYPSPSGRQAPLYLAHLKGTRPGPDAPVLMYGYGFGGWSVSPWFRAHMAEWFRMGGVFALPALRGGGEYGTAWREAGSREHRQNAVDDYLAAAEWLIGEGLASSERLVAETNSAGGPVVGAALLQRPDLFGAAIFGFPLLDLLRYDRFTGGARWVGELGAPTDSVMAPALAGISPVHNVDPGVCYPPTLLTPGERDETTPPFHAYKFAAALRHAQGCESPVLLRMSWGAGHAYGRDQETSVENFADQLAFLTRALGLSPGS